MTEIAYLPQRGVVEISGADRVAFLQGLVSNDVTRAAPGEAVWAALLTPQGKYLADFFVFSQGEALLLECDAAQVEMVAQKLSRFRLRAKVVIRDVSAAWFVHAAWGGGLAVPADAVAARDPRLAEAGWRVLAREALAADGSAAYAAHRLALGLPDAADMEPEKTVLLEAGFDELGGVSWTKGCYMGQELTARTKYRGLIKRRLVPVAIEGEAPEAGAAVWDGEVEVGTMRSAVGGLGLATLRLDALEGALRCGAARLVPRVPGWMRLG